MSEDAGEGALRADEHAEEFATYCLDELAAAGRLPPKAAITRLVVVTLACLRPQT
jgi:hypothetical protein